MSAVMNTMANRVGVLVAAVLIAVTLPTYAAGLPAPSAFTYQGRLLDFGAPANGVYDLQFRLLDGAAGTEVAMPLELTKVPVEGGIFTVELDFGAAVFSAGEARWIEIAVREHNSAAPGLPFEVLQPAQSVTPAPYALYALSGLPGPAGPEGPQGNQGPAGPSGIAKTVNVAGQVGSIAAAPGVNAWVFSATTTNVHVEAGQTLIASGALALGTAAGTASPVSVTPCYQLNSSGLVNSFNPTNFPDVPIGPGRILVPAAGTAKITTTGDYKVGFCVRNYSSVALTNNDWVNGWFMVTN